jgi:hypothetical protein
MHGADSTLSKFEVQSVTAEPTNIGFLYKFVQCTMSHDVYPYFPECQLNNYVLTWSSSWEVSLRLSIPLKKTTNTYMHISAIKKWSKFCGGRYNRRGAIFENAIL